jgi:NifU-like protein involved in Fe-S cluster formation
VNTPLEPELPPTVRRLFTQLHHSGPLGGGGEVVVQGEAGSIAQGVQIRFFWQIEGSLIRAASYQAYGCPYTLAACEWLARALPGRSRAEPWPGDPHQWAQALEAPPERLGRLLVIEDALRATQAAWP